MKRSKTARRTRKQSRPLAGPKSRSLAMEFLEPRRVLSSVPVLTTYKESDNGGDFPGMPDVLNVASPVVLNTAPMQRTIVTGTLPGIDPGDVFKVSLEAGQLVTLGALANGLAQSGMRLVLADSNGVTVAKNLGVNVDPETGAAVSGLALTYRATATGVYYVGLFNQFPDMAPADRTYALSVRPVGINSATPTNSALLFADGAMYAQLRAGRLQIVGPTGYGFELTGKWTKTITTDGATTRQTYSATGSVGVVTPLGTLAMPLPKGTAVIVTTKPNGWGGEFGEIDKTRIVSGLYWLDKLLADANSQFGLAATLPDGSAGLDVLQGQEIGLALGSKIISSIDINAPLNPAIPYLYFVASAGVSASFGNVSVSAAQTRLSIIVDPSDSIYVGVNIPIPIAGIGVPAVAVGLSKKGLIPFKAAVKPDKYDPAAATFRGHFYALGEVNIPIPVQPEIQVNVGGTVLLNFDANGDGGLLTYLKDQAQTTMSELFKGHSLLPVFAGLPQALIVNLGFAVNGKAGLTLSAEPFGIPASVTFTLAKGTYIATGTTTPKVFFRGEMTDNVLAGTFLAPYMKFVRPVQTIILDGAASPGMLMASFEAKYEFFGFEATATHMLVGTNLNVPGMGKLTTTVSAKVSLFGAANVMFTGQIKPDGTFRLDGTSDITIAGFKFAGATLVLTKDGLEVNGKLVLPNVGNVMMSGKVTAGGAITMTGSAMTNFGLGQFAPNVNADFTLSSANGLSAKTTVSFLGQSASLEGKIQPNGDFSLTGTTKVGFSTFIQDFMADVSVTLETVNGTPKLRGDFDNKIAGLGFDLRMVGNLTLVFDAIVPTYMGGGSTTGTGPFGIPIDVSGTVQNNKLVFDLGFGKTLTVPLPL